MNNDLTDNNKVEVSDNNNIDLPEQEMTKNFTNQGLSNMKSAISQIGRIKQVRIGIIVIVIFLLLGVTANILKSRKDESSNNQEVDNVSESDYSPGSEINLPQDDGNNKETKDEFKKNNTPPAAIVSKFLEYNWKNDRKSAISLLSPSVKTEEYRPTLEGVDNEESLYGKRFDFNIYNTYVEKNGNLSRVSVAITNEGKSYTVVYILIWEDGDWKLLNKEVYEPVIIKSE